MNDFFTEYIFGFLWFSEFHRDFFSTLSLSFGTKLVLANTVYCEYIKDHHHIHMNWVALTGDVHWLESQGKIMNLNRKIQQSFE